MKRLLYVAQLLVHVTEEIILLSFSGIEHQIPPVEDSSKHQERYPSAVPQERVKGGLNKKKIERVREYYNTVILCKLAKKQKIEMVYIYQLYMYIHTHVYTIITCEK